MTEIIWHSPEEADYVKEYNPKYLIRVLNKPEFRTDEKFGGYYLCNWWTMSEDGKGNTMIIVLDLIRDDFQYVNLNEIDHIIIKTREQT